MPDYTRPRIVYAAQINFLNSLHPCNLKMKLSIYQVNCIFSIQFSWLLNIFQRFT